MRTGSAKDSLILCSYLFPILFSGGTFDNLGDPSIESKILSAITGNEKDGDGLYREGNTGKKRTQLVGASATGFLGIA